MRRFTLGYKDFSRDRNGPAEIIARYHTHIARNSNSSKLAVAICSLHYRGAGLPGGTFALIAAWTAHGADPRQQFSVRKAINAFVPS
jgi:hypothetical protein